ncbi:hypothetical protein Efla_001874 [Eimeria flavescens]
MSSCPASDTRGCKESHWLFKAPPILDASAASVETDAAATDYKYNLSEASFHPVEGLPASSASCPLPSTPYNSSDLSASSELSSVFAGSSAEAASLRKEAQQHGLGAQYSSTSATEESLQLYSQTAPSKRELNDITPSCSPSSPEGNAADSCVSYGSIWRAEKPNKNLRVSILSQSADGRQAGHSACSFASKSPPSTCREQRGSEKRSSSEVRRREEAEAEAVVEGLGPSCCGTAIGAEDGRHWLDRLEKLRSGASREEYKKERSRVMDALIKRAASYPKISGIYFDKHQVNVQSTLRQEAEAAESIAATVARKLRWSVGWAHHGRRAAKYFPVKLFGMREGYGMAVRFKSNKNASPEPAGSPSFPSSASSADNPAAAETGEHCRSRPAVADEARMPSSAECRNVAHSQVRSCFEPQPTGGSSAVAAPPAVGSVHTQPLDKQEAAAEQIPPAAAVSPSVPSTNATGVETGSGPANTRWSITAEDQKRVRGPSTRSLMSGEKSACRTDAQSLSSGHAFRVDSKWTPLPLPLKPSEPSAAPVQFQNQDALKGLRKPTLFCLPTRACTSSWKVDVRPTALATSSASSASAKQQSQQGGNRPTAGLLLQPSDNEAPGIGDYSFPDHHVVTPESNMVVPPAWAGQQQQRPTDWPCSEHAGSLLEAAVTSPHPLPPYNCAATPDLVAGGKGVHVAPQIGLGLTHGNTIDVTAACPTHDTAEGLPSGQSPQLHHTTGIHFDKHSLRWKATWYDNSGQRRAKYFPIGRGKYGFEQARLLAIQTRMMNHVPRDSRSRERMHSPPVRANVQSSVPPPSASGVEETEDKRNEPEQTAEVAELLETYQSQNSENTNCTHRRGISEAHSAADALSTCGLGGSSDDGYDEEKDKRLSKAPSRILIRHASRLSRVPGIWFDKKQLRWACTFTDAQNGKRRAEYFPIRHFGFLGARRLAVTTRRKMILCQSQRISRGQTGEKLREEETQEEPCGTVKPSEYKSAQQATLEHNSVKATIGAHDLWNKYVLETLQTEKLAPSFFTDAGKLIGSIDGPHHAYSLSPSATQTENTEEPSLSSNSKSDCDNAEDGEFEAIKQETLTAKRCPFSKESENLLSLGRQAVQYLLLDLKTSCLKAIAHVLSARDSAFQMVLQRHSVWVDQIECCEDLEQYLVIFAECIKHMRLPSHLCQAEQRRLLDSIAALALPSSAPRKPSN